MSGKGADYRPICDTWLLAPGKTHYYGSFPHGFINRARCLLCRINEPLLHVCSGNVRAYEAYGVGIDDITLDINPAMLPDFLQDARDPWPMPINAFRGDYPYGWPGVLIDPPYTEHDAERYGRYNGFSSEAIDFRSVLPTPAQLMKRAWEVVMPGGKVGILHQRSVKFTAPDLRVVAMITVSQGENQINRTYKVFEKTV